MALIKHRKLFPTSSANQTIDGCPEICDVPTYTYPDFDVLPPPLSQPPPPELYFSGNTSDQHVSPYVIIIASLLASLFLLVSYYVIIVKYCNGCSRFGRRRTSRSLAEVEEEEFIDEVHGPTVDHPIWYIATVGLQSSDINSITIFKYKRCDNLIEGTDCSVCLSEFRDDEMLRLLPKCNHAFHISCIDTWLRSHTNCPLCRAGIVPNNVVNSSGNSAVTDQSSSVLRRNEEPRVENIPNGGELVDVNQVRNESLVQVADNAGTENSESDDQRKKIENFKAEVVSNGNGIFWVVDTSSDNDELGSQNTKQRMKRSFSVDLDSIGDTADEITFEERSPPIAEPLPLKMKKSFSYSGKSFFSRQYGSQSTIFPL